MPVPELMTWVPRTRQWTAMHKGKRFWISCRQLGITPQTKEASVQAANEWWKAKRAEIDAASLPAPRTPLPMEDTAAVVVGIPPADFFDRLLAFWNKAKVGEVDAGSGAEQDAKIEARFAAEQDAKEIIENVWRLLGQSVIENKPLPDGIAELLPPARVHQITNAVKEIRGESATAPERTNKAQAAAWIAHLGKKVDAGQLTAARVNNVRMALAHYTRWLGETADVASIDADKLEGFYEHCLEQVAARRKDKKTGWSLPFAKEVFAVARDWIKWLSKKIIDPPRNLADRFKFGSTSKKIPTWTVEEVRHVIGEAPGKLKLALLLMANCGMTQVDVSDLADDEVDWKRGTITRRRSKTKDNENVPVVTYRLWPLTWNLLKQYRSGKDTVLLTESVKHYVRSEMVNGKLVKADGFTSNYAHLKRRLKFKKSMKLLRKTSASLLENHKATLPSGESFNPYAGCVTLFLGHAPASVKEKSYATPPQSLFDDAVVWLGRQFGFIAD